MVKRRLSVVVFRVYIGAALDKFLNHGLVASDGGLVKRRLSADVSRVYNGAVLD